MRRLAGLLLLSLAAPGSAKWVEGRINTKENWAFVSRFCFLSLNGQFEYLIEYDKDMGIPNLLMYYDDARQWPAVYHSAKSCKEKEAVLNRGQNQIIRLSHWYPDTEYSGCVLTKANRELPASKSTAAPTPPTNKPTTASPHISFYDQFLKTTPLPPNTTWYEVPNSTSQEEDVGVTEDRIDDELWESIGDMNGTKAEMRDVEILFDGDKHGHKIKRSANAIIQRYRRRLQSEPQESKERLLVSCHNTRRFRSARERWWFIAVSNCDNNKGLDIKYKFLMTNGPEGDFWKEHFSADEFYVLPILLAYTFAYVIVIIAVVVCSVELKSRHLLHSTYKLFLFSVVSQHAGVLCRALAGGRYAAQGRGGEGAKLTGELLCGISEMSFVLMLLLLGKGYTVTRGRLGAAFTAKLTVYMCAYMLAYVVLFICQAKTFDPGEVLYLYESPAGYGIVVLRISAWFVFAYSTFCTAKKHPQKTMFYCPFFICGTLWFFAGPLFILTANNFIDKWVRESVVTAVLLFITFCGHVMFLLLTLPVFANKNFPYHVRTTQIGVMEVSNNPNLEGYGHAYQPSAGASQTVIIPLTRRTEELIGNIYSQYMASAPPISPQNETNKLNGYPRRLDSPRKALLPQNSTETNSSDDIKPILQKDDIFTVESHISKMENVPIAKVLPVEKKYIEGIETKSAPFETQNGLIQNGGTIQNGISTLSTQLTVSPQNGVSSRNSVSIQNGFSSATGAEDQNGVLRGELPSIMRSRRNILEPLRREEVPVPSWSLAKGPSVVGMVKKSKSTEDDVESNLQTRKVPPVRNGLRQSSGEISTIVEGRVQSYVSEATADLFTAANFKNN